MQTASAPGARVLIVEDNSSESLCLRRLLEHYGCQVDHAGTVADGMKGALEEPAYILLDLGLPDGEGTQILEEVKRQNLSSRVFIITGAGDPVLLRRAKSLLPDALLPKPVNFLQILELMKPVA